MYDVPAGIALLVLAAIMLAGGLIANVRHEKAQAMRRHPSARIQPSSDWMNDEERAYHTTRRN